jgi:Flp pilus assembly protein TadG
MLLQSLKNRSSRLSASGRPGQLSVRQGRRSGAAVVELALTLMILFGVCYGTIEFGYYFFIKNTVEGAAREACRAGIVAGATASNCTSAALTQLQTAGLVSSTATVGGSGPWTIGNYTVTLYDNNTSTPVTSLGSFPVGDTLITQISCSWGVVGTGFSFENIISSSKQIMVSSSMRKEG